MDPLPTAAVADACVRLQVQERHLPLRAVLPGRIVAGPAVPVRHAGSVDIFFEAVRAAPKGGVLVIENEGRLDEGCIGDLTAYEAKHHGIAAIAVDGCHRDTAALREVDLPVWSRAACPFGPRAARPRPTDALDGAMVHGFLVKPGDVVVLDDDGGVVVAKKDAKRVWDLAAKIVEAEGKQAKLARDGTPLCKQFDVDGYVKARDKDPTITFRAHLKKIGKAIEE